MTETKQQEDTRIHYCQKCKTYTLGTIDSSGHFHCNDCGEMTLSDNK